MQIECYFGAGTNIIGSASVKAAAKILSDNLWGMYTGNKTGGDFPGRFPAPYYWWESGAVFGVRFPVLCHAQENL